MAQREVDELGAVGRVQFASNGDDRCRLLGKVISNSAVRQSRLSWVGSAGIG